MSGKPFATAVVQFHPADDDSFRVWLERVTRTAESMPGFRSLRRSEATGGLQLAVAATFDTAENLHAWLDSDAVFGPNTEGVLRKTADVLIIAGHRLPPGVAVFRHDVIPGKAADFLAAQHDLVTSTSRFPGYIGTVVLPPAPEAGVAQWTSVLCFRTDAQLAAWSASEERAHRLKQLRSHLRRDFDTISVDAPFGSIVRFDDGKPTVTPRWKTAMLILLVLYPTVMTLTRFLAPVLAEAGSPPWLTMWLSEIVSVAALTFVMMPLATRLFARWLDPVDGGSLRVTVVGVLVVLAVYAATLWLFDSVQWLHYWGR